MKEIVILKHGGGELANQLWSYISIYAYGLEIDAPVRNPSFFEYHSFFNLLSTERTGTRMLSRLFNTPRRRSHVMNRAARLIYVITVMIRSFLHSPCVVSSENTENKVRYLPPSSPVPTRFGECGILYFTGWLFRNPFGIDRRRSDLLKIFSPNKIISDKVDSVILPMRKKFQNIIGIHIRQGDYNIFKGGRYLISQERIREIVSEYAKEKFLDAGKTAFIIASDGLIDERLYKGLNVYFSKENSVTDLFLLSRTDTIIGSDSSFGAFASWYGNITHIICKKEAIDWAYYSDKKSYFDNKYLTLFPR